MKRKMHTFLLPAVILLVISNLVSCCRNDDFDLSKYDFTTLSQFDGIGLGNDYDVIVKQSSSKMKVKNRMNEDTNDKSEEEESESENDDTYGAAFTQLLVGRLSDGTVKSIDYTNGRDTMLGDDVFVSRFSDFGSYYLMSAYKRDDVVFDYPYADNSKKRFCTSLYNNGYLYPIATEFDLNSYRDEAKFSYGEVRSLYLICKKTFKIYSLFTVFNEIYEGSLSGHRIRIGFHQSDVDDVAFFRTFCLDEMPAQINGLFSLRFEETLKWNKVFDLSSSSFNEMYNGDYYVSKCGLAYSDSVFYNYDKSVSFSEEGSRFLQHRTGQIVKMPESAPGKYAFLNGDFAWEDIPNAGEWGQYQINAGIVKNDPAFYPFSVQGDSHYCFSDSLRDENGLIDSKEDYAFNTIAYENDIGDFYCSEVFYEHGIIIGNNFYRLKDQKIQKLEFVYGEIAQLSFTDFVDLSKYDYLTKFTKENNILCVSGVLNLEQRNIYIGLDGEVSEEPIVNHGTRLIGTIYPIN